MIACEDPVQTGFAQADVIRGVARCVEDLNFKLVDPQPTYVRVDLVRNDRDRYLLMELELIEPSLYLRTDAGSAMRFARAFDRAASA